nr:methyl-accepting chemotaxis protein [Chromobacterium sp. ASV5]
MSLNTLSLKQQMALLLAVPCLAMALAMAAALLAAQTLHRHAGALYQHTAQPMRAMAEVASRIPRMRVGIDMMLLQETALRDDKGVAGRVREAREEDIPAMRQAMRLAVEAQADPAARAKAQALRQRFDDMERQALQPLLQALEAGDLAAARQLYRQTYIPHYNAMRGDSARLLDNLLEQASAAHRQSEADYQASRLRLLLVSGGALALAVLLGLVIMRYLDRRVGRLQGEMARAASELALNRRSDLEGRDELARIAGSYNALLERLDDAMARAQRFSREVQGTAQRLTQAAGAVSQASARQADSAQTVAASVEQVAVSVQHVASATHTTAQLSDALRRRSAEGMRTLNDSAGSIRQVSRTLDQATEQARALASHSDHISGFVATIRDIADQTNLLALNAAIEAARAGESGRGFAVVADEVRKLAERTTQATAQIGQLLADIDGQIDKVVASMRDGVGQMRTSSELVENARGLMQDISGEADSAAQSVRGIADSSREQGLAAETIAHSIEKIVQMAEQNHHQIDGAQRQAGELSRLAEELGAEMARFATSPRG